MIVITTPTGTIGRQVLADLLAGDQPVRVIVRDPAKLPAAVRDSVEVVPGSHGDPEVVAKAFAGADALFWVAVNAAATTPEEAYTGFTRAAVEAIRTQGVRRVVDVSSLGRGTAVADQAGHITASLAMDDLIASTGVAFRALALPGFMDNMLRQVKPIKEQGRFFDIIAGDRPDPTAATRDIAAIATRLLTDDSWTGQEEVPVLGPADLSADEQAAIMSEVLGFEVRYQRIPAQALIDRMTGRGLPAAIVASLVEMFNAKDRGIYDGVTRTPRHAIEAPTTFRQFCAEVLKPAVDAA